MGDRPQPGEEGTGRYLPKSTLKKYVAAQGGIEKILDKVGLDDEFRFVAKRLQEAKDWLAKKIGGRSV